MNTIRQILKNIPGYRPIHFLTVQSFRSIQYQRAKIARRKFDQRLAELITGSTEININLGAGLATYPGWIPVQFTQLDACDPKNWSRYFLPNSISKVLSEHVWEHLSLPDGLEAARLVLRHLKPGGCFRIAVPDRNHPSPSYQLACKPDRFILGHKVFYEKDQLVGLLRTAGFSQVTPLEWFDGLGQFHQQPWDEGGGYIQRSARRDPRNRMGELAYTSLIVDAVK